MSTTNETKIDRLYTGWKKFPILHPFPDRAITASVPSSKWNGRKEDLPRGIRNNNPGCIRRTSIDWLGKILPKDNQIAQIDRGLDPEFEVFADFTYGLRAILKILEQYTVKHGITKVFEVVQRWAPHNENDTEEYLKAITRWTKTSPHSNMVGRGDEIRKAIFRIPLAAAIARYETGGWNFSGEAWLCAIGNWSESRVDGSDRQNTVTA